jgi:cytochrome c2
MLVGAPLMTIGMPFVATMWAFSPATRASVAAQFRRPLVGMVWERSTGPLTVLILHAVVLWAWHVPAMFEAALHNETIHVVQHLCFFITAALFWWALIHGRYGRVGYGVGVLYVFATAMHTQVLGALLTFGHRPWYPTHAMRTGAHALDDQQLAGIVMWIPFGVIFVLIGLALFAAWLGEAERRVSLTTADSITRILLIVLFLSRCHGHEDVENARLITQGGDAHRGQSAIQKYGCGACHEIPGVNAANGLVGPPLTKIADRTYLAGQLPNQPDNMIKWIQHPDQVEHGTAMPNLNVNERDARDIAAYLYTLASNPLGPPHPIPTRHLPGH